MIKSNKIKLAIVIPAYSDSFLKETLCSLANQTCQDFTLYIGDDASPNNLESVVEEYYSKLNIIYKKFDKNEGGTNLVKQWERCIDLSTEQWIWLFSDDDIMDNNCVEAFYQFISENKTAEFLHFNLDVIDKSNKVIWTSNHFPDKMEINDFFTKRIQYKIRSTVVEYVFSRSLYDRENGFKNFDLAWCSDDATWLKFGKDKGIITIPNAKVKWRYSGENISSKVKDPDLVLRKLKSTSIYLKWVDSFFKENKVKDTSSEFDKIKWGIAPLLESPTISLRTKLVLTNKFLNDYNSNEMQFNMHCYIFFWEFKKSIKEILREIKFFNT